jgi:hypothetical protein
MARIWNSGVTAVERTILWDQARNGYHIDHFDWEREENAPPTKCQSKRVYPHVAGWRLRCALTFNIWQPGRGPRMNTTALDAGFTENDKAALDNALKAGQHIEFYLHGRSAGSDRVAARCCQFWVRGSERPERQVMHRMTLEFEGLQISTTSVAEL